MPRLVETDQLEGAPHIVKMDNILKYLSGTCYMGNGCLIVMKAVSRNLEERKHGQSF